ncbi:type II secretion system protein [Halovenus sp. WSH3]|uniref:Type II secretion system protein n=1 Tax=Halovenus carboxidivorans TaxID=2692199 RepID=A0A6B0T7P1_9EURY|nr:type II secretion system protein [Halovenus carboxidivorans]
MYPWRAEPSTELRLALDFLGRPVDPAAVVEAGYVAGLVVGFSLSLSAVVVPPQFRAVAVLAAVTVGLLTTHTVQSAPRLLATARRTAALGAAPDLVARTVLSMRLSPTPERAADFAARTGSGVLAASLADHVRQSRHTGLAGFVSFGDAWADLFPSLRRSVALVSAAGNATDRDRERLLDRALTVVMEGTRDQMESFGAWVRTPVTALYAFGVLLPTALVALLPAGSAVGVAVTPLTVVTLYDIALPGVLLGASAWLLANRPVAFPPPAITTDHDGVPDRRRLAVAVSLGVAVCAGVAAGWVTPLWGRVVAASGFGVGVGLWLYYRPVVSQYEHIRRIERSLPDALTLVGRRVANGRAVETAIEHTGEELDDEIGAVFRAGSLRHRQLQIGVEEAFLGRNGVLEAVPSPRVRGSVALLALAAEAGRPAGTALLALGDHVEDLQAIEREAKRGLTHVCQTLKTTGMLFGPLVAGATVALAEGIGGEEFLAEQTQSLVWLGGPVGVYALLLAVVLTGLATGLTRGLDRELLGYQIGRGLVCATGAYLIAYLLVGRLL